MKNTVVLKNIKSNLVEEAIIIFKENVKIKEKQLIKGNQEESFSDKENIPLIEAENVISDYIEEYEKEKTRNILRSKMNILKAINISLVVLLVVAIVF